MNGTDYVGLIERFVKLIYLSRPYVIAGARRSCQDNEVDSAFFAVEYVTARPASERFVNRKLLVRGVTMM